MKRPSCLSGVQGFDGGAGARYEDDLWAQFQYAIKISVIGV